jgi:hypothetical protein
VVRTELLREARAESSLVKRHERLVEHRTQRERLCVRNHIRVEVRPHTGITMAGAKDVRGTRSNGVWGAQWAACAVVNIKSQVKSNQVKGRLLSHGAELRFVHCDERIFAH